MIEIQVKIHDKFSLEFKVGFLTWGDDLSENTFRMNTWIFVPNSLDINPATYTKPQFYRDVNTNTRLITPIFPLGEIASGEAVPLRHLRDAFGSLAEPTTKAAAAKYEYQIKMFSAIFKSSVRDEVRHILGATVPEDIDYLTESYRTQVHTVMSRYREQRKTVDTASVPPRMLDYFLFGDEFMSNLLIQHTLRLIQRLQTLSETRFAERIAALTKLVREEEEYRRKQGYLNAETESPDHNRALLFCHGVLKKYVESDLFLNARRKKDAVWVEQVYYSLAAGLSMIFATTVAFSFQMKYGNFTMPLFVALVVSYMLKDRIKELMRYYFAHRLGSRYFDNKTTIGIKEDTIGWSKEGVDFITDGKVPRQVMEIRSRSPLLEAENRISDEKIILYRKMVRIDRRKLSGSNRYSIAGIHEIIRLHMNSFTQKMDNPQIPIYALDAEGTPRITASDKVYYLNLVMQFQYDARTDYKRYRIVLTRAGIQEIEELK